VLLPPSLYDPCGFRQCANQKMTTATRNTKAITSRMRGAESDILWAERLPIGNPLALKLPGAFSCRPRHSQY
jgi:hypothetical protein